ncbi:MAG: hypothetical protein WCP23_13440 [Planctomycetota bacterium]
MPASEDAIALPSSPCLESTTRKVERIKSCSQTNMMRIAAVEHSIPSLQVTNDDIIKELLARSARHLDVPSSALLARTLEALFKRSRTLVRYRHVAPEKAIDFGVDGGRQAIATAGMVPEDIDLLIYVGVSRGFLEPATANVFQHEFGFTKATCFDVLDACAGNE